MNNFELHEKPPASKRAEQEVAIDIDKLETLANEALHHAWGDSAWEALNRLIENGQELGDASREDALLVARYRDRQKPFAASFTPATVIALIDRLRESEAREQALAAHAERLSALVSHVLEQFEKDARGEPMESDEDAWQWHGRAVAAVSESPTTSLARRDAWIAAQTAQQIHWNVSGNCIGHETLQPRTVLGWLGDYAEQYARQAEEASDGD